MCPSIPLPLVSRHYCQYPVYIVDVPLPMMKEKAQRLQREMLWLLLIDSTHKEEKKWPNLLNCTH